MIALRQARVVEIKRERTGYVEAIVELGGNHSKAICYSSLVGGIQPGDNVVINTTAVDLGLGTGGYHFVIWNLSKRSVLSHGEGHIMKLRYTPLQLKCLSVEEEDSPYHEILKDVTSIDGMPVIIGTLHSQLPAAAVMLKSLLPDISISYIMTDGAALPIAFSETVAKLKSDGVLDTTITVGHAFGGDLEAINVFSGLAAAKHAAKADVAIACMGPGIVGSNTKLGFTGIEQGQIINAVNGLNGRPIAIPRLSFADRRGRHIGLSHHTATALMVSAMTKAVITVPRMEKEKEDLVMSQIADAGIDAMHDVIQVDARQTLDALKERGIRPTTMGRSADEEPEFFMAAGVAGIYAANILQEGISGGKVRSS